MQKIQRIQWLVFLVLLQVLVLNYVHIGQYATPLFYIYFILKFHTDTGRKELMLWSFAIGLCIDIFSNTPGMNAAAAVLLAFFRPLLLRSQLLRGSTDLFEPGIRVMGFLPFLRYAFAGVLVHVTALDMLDVFSWAHFDVLILKIVSDVAVTLFCILCVDAVRRKK